MASRRVHTAFGLGAGGLVAACRSSDLKPAQQGWEIIGGLVGGYIGSRLPDVIEPAVSPNHRAFFHSTTFGCISLAGIAQSLERWETQCRERADATRQLRDESSRSTCEHVLLTLLEWLYRIGAGFVSGLSAGYGSHLALDAMTPRGLPVL